LDERGGEVAQCRQDESLFEHFDVEWLIASNLSLSGSLPREQAGSPLENLIHNGPIRTSYWPSKRSARLKLIFRPLRARK
jgi:hypothetical protein